MKQHIFAGRGLRVAVKLIDHEDVDVPKGDPHLPVLIIKTLDKKDPNSLSERHYYGVPHDLYEKFIESDVPGEFFSEHISSHFNSKKIQ